jgi:spore maturation protein CgeB
MNIKLFYHSLLSDWNHGNAHFLRGITRELIKRGNDVEVFEPEDSWSLTNLLNNYGDSALNEFHNYYPLLTSTKYNLKNIDLDKALGNSELVIVHEWNDPDLVDKMGRHHLRHNSYKLLFHDTHHRAATKKDEMLKYNLKYYDGVLAYGKSIKNIYLENNWTKNAWTWHEAADTSIFFPRESDTFEGDIVWIGNWGDEERTEELYEFLIEPVRKLKLKCKIFGVRYPDSALKILTDAGIEYGGWLPNFKVPEIFSKYKLTVHIPRRPYVELLPGIPTIRPFEALACGIPLISSRWSDAENLFSPGKDFLVAQNGKEMTESISLLLRDQNLAKEISENGLRTIIAKHTCSHRADELEQIYKELSNKIKTLV